MKARLDFSGNIAKSYLYSFISSLSFSEAIWMLYLAHRGMSLVQIGLLESVFHLTSLLMEVPTGIVADRFGRRTSRALSRLVALAATLLMLASRDFGGFVLAFVFVALGYNLESGAGDALVYDSLVDEGRQGDYMKVKGRLEIGYQSAQGLSIVAGGLAATWSYELAYVLGAAVHFLAFLLSLGFREPRTGRSPTGEAAHPSLLRHILDSAAVIRGNRGILVYILFIESFSLFYTTLWFYSQNFLKGRGYREWAIGLVLGASSVAGVIMATQAHRIEASLGKRRLVSLAPIVAMAGFGLVAFTGLEAWALILLSAVEGLLFVSFSDYVNRLIPSESRATLLSFEAMVFSTMMIVFFPAIGALSSARGFKTAFAAIFVASVPVLLGARSRLLGSLDRT
jgi:MFS family permease